jgi:hypothetical protein
MNINVLWTFLYSNYYVPNAQDKVRAWFHKSHRWDRQFKINNEM